MHKGVRDVDMRVYSKWLHRLEPEGNITGTNRLTRASTDLLYTNAHAHCCIHHSNNKWVVGNASEWARRSFNGVSRATQAHVLAMWWCFLPRHFHSQVDIKWLVQLLVWYYNTSAGNGNRKKTWAPAQSHQMMTLHTFNFTVCTKRCYWYILHWKTQMIQALGSS